MATELHDEPVVARVATETGRARVVLVHEPGTELLSALLWPEEGSFAATFDSDVASREHRTYCEALADRDIEVISVREALRGRDDLARRAAPLLHYEAREGGSAPPVPQDIVDRLGFRDVVRILLEHPIVVSGSVSNDPALVSRPLSNLYFTRDPLITTDRGVVLGRFKRPVRRPEVEVMRLVLEALGVDPLYEVVEPGVLEGGDFVPAGDYALLGVGARTNLEAVRQLTTGPGAAALGYAFLAVVRDPEQGPALLQQQMHLDTYFSIVGERVCLVEASRIGIGVPGTPGGRIPRVDVYAKVPDGEDYRPVPGATGLAFPDFLRDHLGMQLVPLTFEDQDMYGCNVLCVRDMAVLGSTGRDQELVHDRQLWEYGRSLAAAGVEVELLDFSEIRKGYGANRCMTQVLVRD